MPQDPLANSLASLGRSLAALARAPRIITLQSIFETWQACIQRCATGINVICGTGKVSIQIQGTLHCIDEELIMAEYLKYWPLKQPNRNMLIYSIYKRYTGPSRRRASFTFMLNKSFYILPGVRYNAHTCICYLDIGGAGVFPWV